MGRDKKSLAEQYQSDTIRKFENAAVQRFRDAEVLAENGRRLAAIYLYGYSVEMLLKAACCRLDGIPVNHGIDLETMKRLKSKPETNRRLQGGGQQAFIVENLHDIGGWAQLMVAELMLQRPQSDRGELRRIVIAVEEIRRRWSPEMRYRPTDPSEADLREVREAAGRLRTDIEKIMSK
ncbi:MAG TPA: hypothetical protein VG406_13160 [Isosphaeraceae bacterium]|nr:hypothetical protein [Isosphaeraceae bacterium]